jgi:4-amino-4-deoxy-L-arabinose transferase-like glycosyltransferase
MTNPRFRVGFIAILIAAFLIRSAAALYLGNEVTGLSGAQDEISYSMLGQRFAAGHGLTFPENWYPWILANAPQSYYSATMSLYLGAIYSAFGYQPIIARLVTALLSTLAVAMIVVLSRRLFGDSVALASGLIAAVYPYLVFYGATLVTETPFILAVFTAIYLAYRTTEVPSLPRWLGLGVALAVAVLFRMAVLFFAVPLLIWIAWRTAHRRTMALIPVAVIVLCVLPFTVHNYRTWGSLLLLEAQFGHVFWNGNHPGHQGDFHPYRVFTIPEDVLANRNDVQITNQLLRLGIQNVINDPESFARLTVTRLREFFRFWPVGESETLVDMGRMLSFGLLLPFAVGGMVVSAHRWRELAPLLLFIVAHMAPYAVTWTMIRYRIPLDAVLIPFSVVGAIWVGERARRLLSPNHTGWSTFGHLFGPRPPMVASGRVDRVGAKAASGAAADSWIAKHPHPIGPEE